MIGHEFTDWQSVPMALPYVHCSPNLRVLLDELERRWAFVSTLGCFGRRAVRGGAAPSTHSWGAALDVGYPAGSDGVIRDEVCGFLVGRSLELGVQAIHDYRRSRIWRAGRTPRLEDACTTWWRAQRPSAVTGMGQAWSNHLHVETTASSWANDVPVRMRWDE